MLQVSTWAGKSFESARVTLTGGRCCAGVKEGEERALSALNHASAVMR